MIFRNDVSFLIVLLLLRNVNVVHHGGAYLLEYEERQQYEYQQSYYRMPCVDERIAIERQVYVYQEIMPEREQYT